jgi:outer membrane protein OmpA-like peptidoglycan-associated protein
MRRFLYFVIALPVVALISPFMFGQNDSEGAKDYPGITRMPGYYISGYTEAQFDSASFPVTENGQEKQQEVEGHLYKIEYYIKDNAPPTSTLQLVRNYQNAARAASGKVLYEVSGDNGNWRNTTLRLTKGDKELWVYIGARTTTHTLTIIEKQAMKQEVSMDANAMANDLTAGGRVAIYGIYFDSGKSDLKPESEPALAEMAKLLRQNSGLKVFVVGHTDMVGDAAMNVRLSQARAQSVVTALTTRYGIAGTRLAPFGNGPYAPVASNKDEDGRAKNRRVELVEIATK